MSVRPASGAFAKRSHSHVLILASGDKVRHVTVRPWMVAIVTSIIGAFGIGYLAATTYLVLRDDLIGGTIARQARMQHEYEDRITALRAQVDRVTSRQLLDQQVVEQKVEKLLRQQLEISSRSGRLGALSGAAVSAKPIGQDAPPPVMEPPAYDEHAGGKRGLEAIEKIMGVAERGADAPPARAALAYAPPKAEAGETTSDRADRIFSKVTLSLKDVERDQVTHIRQLTDDALQTSETIRSIVERTGIVLPADETPDVSSAVLRMGEPAGIGGPFVEPQTDDGFDQSLAALDSALFELEETRAAARKLPLASPAPANDITSNFGNRLDPFFGRLALHAGIDFRAQAGTRIRSTAAGTVTAAGPAGGYGNMIEIDHGNGVSTRYAHLAGVLVNIGDRVRADQVIGKSGSTGRSTGPHLHYEVRLNGEPVDPMLFLKAGAKLADYID